MFSLTLEFAFLQNRLPNGKQQIAHQPWVHLAQ